jgi:LemA protein
MFYLEAAVFAVLVVVVVLGFLTFVTYNEVVALTQRINKAWANIDVALRQRFDELPNLVAAVRGAMGFEQEVLTEVTRLRNAYSSDVPVPQQAVTSEATSQAVRRLFATVENYPSLKSATNVLALQAEIQRLEDVIADRRELYNDSVARYNTRIRQVPAVVMAGLVGWLPQPFFAADETERANRPVSLSSPPPAASQAPAQAPEVPSGQAARPTSDQAAD